MLHVCPCVFTTANKGSWCRRSSSAAHPAWLTCQAKSTHWNSQPHLCILQKPPYLLQLSKTLASVFRPIFMGWGECRETAFKYEEQDMGTQESLCNLFRRTFPVFVLVSVDALVPPNILLESEEIVLTQCELSTFHIWLIPFYRGLTLTLTHFSELQVSALTGIRLNFWMCFLFSKVPVVRATWEKDAGFLEFYSDVSDSSIPTVSLGVPNTERGELHTGSTTKGLRDKLQTQFRISESHWNLERMQPHWR